MVKNRAWAAFGLGSGSGSGWVHKAQAKASSIRQDGRAQAARVQGCWVDGQAVKKWGGLCSAVERCLGAVWGWIGLTAVASEISDLETRRAGVPFPFGAAGSNETSKYGTVQYQQQHTDGVPLLSTDVHLSLAAAAWATRS